jgi:protocatechuate 3,4-dioxygenase beta subunit
VRRDGKPAAARVELRREGSGFGALVDRAARRLADDALAGPVRAVDAGDDGVFVFDEIDEERYVVRAEARDGGVGRAYATRGRPGARRRVEVALSTTTGLRGRVVHADGTPWHGTVVVVGSIDGADYPDWCLGATATDADGRFTLSQLPAGEVVVVAVEASGSHVLGAPVVLPTSVEYALVWEGTRVPVAGRVVGAADGAPVRGARVTSTGDGMTFDFGDLAETGDDGRFRVLVRPSGGMVTASALGFSSKSVAVADPSKELELALARDAVVRGVVTRRGDVRGVPGLAVRMLRHDGRDTRLVGRPTKTDAEGRFVARLDPGSYSFFARGEALVSAAFLPGEGAARAAGRVELRAGDDVEITIETVPAARIAGTVRDPDGTPVAGASVHAHRRIWGGAHRTGEAPWDAYGSDEVETDPDGTFELASLVAGLEYVLTATAWGRPGAPERRVRADASAPTLADLTFPAARWVEVTVLDATTGAPVADANVTAFTAGGDPGESEVSDRSRSEAGARTDEQGRARLGPLGPGEVVFGAHARGFAYDNTLRRAPLTDGPHGLSTTLRIQPARRIAGRVLRPDGSPAAGAAVHLSTARSGTVRRTEADGTFVFDDLGDDDRTVRATLEAEGLASETIAAPIGATNLTLRLSMRSVFVRVLGPDGRPVPAARASFSYVFPSGRGSACRPGDVRDGRLVIHFDDDETPAEGILDIEEPTDGEGRSLALGALRVEHVRPGVETVVSLPPERAIDGRVLGPDGTGVVGARVRAEPVDDADPTQREGLEAPWTWGVSRWVPTDASGSFRLGQLRDGPHLVAVLPPPTHAPPATLRRDAGARDVTFTLRAAQSATIRVVGPDGRPVAGARVVAARRVGQRRPLESLFTEYPTGWSTAGETAADGRARLQGLHPDGTFVLGARARTSENLADAVLDRWSPAETTVRLVSGHAVAGVARDGSGVAIVGATIECVDAGGTSRTTTTTDGGAFRFVGLAAGRVRVEATSYMPAGGRVAARTTVEAGAEGVVLELR